MKFLTGVLGVAALLSLPAAAQQGGKPFIVQTNSAGDSVSFIDPVTDKIAVEIPDIEVAHGAAVAPDGSHLLGRRPQHVHHARQGAVVAGSTGGAGYRFRVTNVTDAAVEIAEVEEDVLIFV